VDQIKCFERKAEVNHEIQQLKAKMRDSQVLTLPRPHYLLGFTIKLTRSWSSELNGSQDSMCCAMHYIYSYVTKGE